MLSLLLIGCAADSLQIDGTGVEVVEGEVGDVLSVSLVLSCVE